MIDDALVADNTVPIPYFAQDQSMLAKGLDYDYDNKHTSDDDVVNYDEPENNPYAGRCLCCSSYILQG